MLIGSHVEGPRPLEGARLRGADVVQINLSAPRNWRKPAERKDAPELLSSSLPIFVHAPYLINLATSKPEVWEPSLRCLKEQAEAAAAIGARGLVVHGGHPTGGGTFQSGVEGWVRAFAEWESPLPVLIENTAGGDLAVARRVEQLSVLWSALREVGANVGYCLDTCHAHAGGEDLESVVERTLEITGRIDLVHVNDSKDLFDSRKDRHQNLGAGEIPPELIARVVRLADAPAVVETPGGPESQAADIAWLRERLEG